MKKNDFRKFSISFILSVLVYFLVSMCFSTGMINNYKMGILILCCINIILASSLNLAAGYLGQLTLGHAGFMSVGAYVSAILTKELGMNFVLAIIIGGLFACVIGILIGIPTLRLKGDYLCIITLAFNEIIRVILLNLDITNGAKGFTGISKNTNFFYAYLITMISVFVIYSIVHSRHGRAIVSIREDETASELSGVRTTYYKILTFAISAFFAGVAGALYAHYVTFITPSYFNFNKSVEILVIVVLGGMGNWKGVFVSAIVMTVLPEYLKSFEQYRMLLYAIVLILAMLLKHSHHGQKFIESLKRYNPFHKKVAEVEK